MRALFFAIALALLTCLPGWASDVLIVEGTRDKTYDEAIKGFKASCLVSSRTMVISDYAEFDLSRLVAEERPRVVLAVGEGAVKAAKRLRHVPVVNLMALSAGTSATSVGIGMLVAPDKYLAIMENLKLKRVGVLYNQDKTGAYLSRARQAAKRLGIELVTREVRNSKDVPGQLESLRNKVDALWLLPDNTALAAEVSAAYFHFSQAERLPIVAFADYYLKLGALAVLELDRFDMGRQAGELANRLLSGESPEDIGLLEPRRTSLHINPAIGKKLGIAPAILEKFFSLHLE